VVPLSTRVALCAGLAGSCEEVPSARALAQMYAGNSTALGSHILAHEHFAIWRNVLPRAKHVAACAVCACGSITALATIPLIFQMPHTDVYFNVRLPSVSVNAH
jgi:hypothetical protein